MLSTSLVVSCVIFVLIAVRQWLPPALRIWHIMAAGAVVLLLASEISLPAAFRAVDWNLIFYLFGVFAIAAALYDSGISHAIGRRIVKPDHAERSFFVFILATALCAAVLTNDGAAVIGTPIALMLARMMNWSPSVLLIALCASVTVGSMMSPVGNPQNILIATTGYFEYPLLTFVQWLAVPALVSLAFVFLWLRRAVQNGGAAGDGAGSELLVPQAGAHAWPAYLGTALLVTLIAGDAVLHRIDPSLTVPLGIASLVGCAPVFLFSARRVQILKEVDWPTLAFFVAMFLVTGSLLQAGSLQALLGSLQARLSEPPVTAAISFWASQLFSNVPVVDIYLKLLHEGELPNLMTLAGMSTLAGNLFIISAASNVIVVQQAEKFGQAPFTFWRFTFTVLPITIVSVAVTYGWIAWFGGSG